MNIGVWEVTIILVVVLIIFGAGKLPKVMGDVAKGIKNFKAEMRADSGGAEPLDHKSSGGELGPDGVPAAPAAASDPNTAASTKPASG